jgi:predicted amidohydrolase YtcJ
VHNAQESELGSLERGKKADFVVVGHRVDLDPTLLADHGPEEVWVDGRLRWHAAMGRAAGARGKTCSC